MRLFIRSVTGVKRMLTFAQMCIRDRKVNVWTVNDMEMVQKMIDQQVDYITTDYPLETEKLIRKNGGDS